LIKYCKLALAALLVSSTSIVLTTQPSASAAIPEAPIKVATSAGSDYAATIVLSNFKQVWSFGNSDLNGRQSDYAEPIPQKVQFVDTTNGMDHSNIIKDIGAGAEHFAALTETGQVWSWGENFYGMIGDGTTISKYVPVQVKDKTGSVLSNVYDIAVGTHHTLALKNDRTVWAWGADNRGQLGDSDLSTYSQQSSAVQVMVDPSTPLTNVKEIAAGEAFSMALTYDGKLYTWGDNYFGKLGLGNNSYSYTASYPVQIAGPGINDHNISRIFTNSSFSSVFYTTVSNSVYGWGDNTSGQLGVGYEINNGAGDPPISAPIEIISLRDKNVVDIIGGQEHTLVLTSAGNVLGMGTDTSGQLAHYSNDYNPAVYEVFTPVQLDSSLVNIHHISAGAYSSFAINSSGMLLSFGSNRGYQLGQPKLPIRDTNKDGFDDITWDTYTDDNGDGYDDDYPYRVTKPLSAMPLVEQGYRISGTLKNILNGQPLANVDIALESEEHGQLYTRTDSLGAYQFTHVLKGSHSLHVSHELSSYFNTSRSVEIDVTTDFSNRDLRVEAYWVPQSIQFEDTNPSKDVISGFVRWEISSPPLPATRYKLYFTNELGSNIGVVGTSDLNTPFINIDNLSIPAGAKYLKMFIKSEEPNFSICNTECDTGLTLLINDLIVDSDQVVTGIEFIDHDLDENELSGPINIIPNVENSNISKYMVFWTDSTGYPIGAMLKELSIGEELKIELPSNYVRPSGAALLTVYAFDANNQKVGSSSFFLYDSTQEHLNFYISHLKYKLDPSIEEWTSQEVTDFIQQQTDINEDGNYNKADVNLLLQMISPRTLHGLPSTLLSL
jgi:alpha-tubulin suppressor-like RCC1 family protein